MANVRGVISEHAARLRAMNEEINRAFLARRGGPEHVAAAKAFSENFDHLALPGGLQRGLDKLKQADPEAIEIAIQFLEEDPSFFRSGYIKEDLVRCLKRVALSQRQRVRIAAIVSRSIRQGPRRLAGHIAKLAPVASSPSFLDAIESQTRSDNGEIRRRSAHVLWVLKSHGMAHARAD